MSKKKKGKSSVQDVQDAMPLADIRGHFAILRDGALRAYLKWPSRNHSLSTENERMRDALIMAEILSGIRTGFGILKYPEPASSQQQLVMIDTAIRRERDAMLSAKDPEQVEAYRKRLSILTEKMRPDAAVEATSADRYNWPTWLVLKFPKGTSFTQADQQIETVCRIASDKLDDPLRFATEADIRHICNLYFSSTPISNDPAIYTQVSMPEITLGRR